MKLKAILASAALAASTVFGASATHAADLIFSSGLPPGHTFAKQGFEPWMKCVTDKTNQNVKFNYFPSGQLSPTKGSTEALNAGIAQVALLSPTNDGHLLPLGSIPQLPGLGNGDTASEMSKVLREYVSGDTLYAAELKRNKVHPIMIFSLPPYQIMLATDPIKNLSEFSGHKIRGGGGTMIAAIKALGGVPVQISAADLYVAMQRGTVDGALFSEPSAVSYNLPELLKSMSTNASFGTSTNLLAMSDAGWDMLSSQEQKTVLECGLKVEKQMSAFMDKLVTDRRKEFVELGIALYEFSPEALSAITEVLERFTQSYVEGLESRGIPGNQALKEYRASIKQ